MLADTAAIRGFGRANGAQCADLSAAAAALAAVPTGVEALGPVGARFAAALADAVAHQATQVAGLADHVACGADAAQACANAYDDAAYRATALIRL